MKSKSKIINLNEIKSTQIKENQNNIKLNSFKIKQNQIKIK